MSVNPVSQRLYGIASELEGGRNINDVAYELRQLAASMPGGPSDPFTGPFAQWDSPPKT